MKRTSFLLAAVFAVFVFAVATQAQTDAFAVGTTLEDFKMTDISGKEQSFNALKGKNGAVLVWLSAQCPVVKQYNERINQIAAEYQSKGITFIGINSNATESLDYVKTNASEIGYKFPVLIDKGNVLADKLGATVTPEVYYFDAKNVLLYHGAIDNDKSAQTITEPYLKTAFEAALSGKKIEKTRALATGCSIKRAKKAE